MKKAVCVHDLSSVATRQKPLYSIDYHDVQTTQQRSALFAVYSPDVLIWEETAALSVGLFRLWQAIVLAKRNARLQDHSAVADFKAICVPPRRQLML
jgi:hypothetical protein